MCRTRKKIRKTWLRRGTHLRTKHRLPQQVIPQTQIIVFPAVLWKPPSEPASQPASHPASQPRNNQSNRPRSPSASPLIELNNPRQGRKRINLSRQARGRKTIPGQARKQSKSGPQQSENVPKQSENVPKQSENITKKTKMTSALRSAPGL